MEEETWAYTDLSPDTSSLSLCLGQGQQSPGVSIHCQPFTMQPGTSSKTCDNWLDVEAFEKCVAHQVTEMQCILTSSTLLLRGCPCRLARGLLASQRTS